PITSAASRLGTTAYQTNPIEL
nr:CpcI2=C-phycocyanin-associated rod-linker polypeptide [Calothrix sp., PCC 7601, phycobilisomes, Peptide Partial, 21 aa] [Calothrix]